MAAHQLYNYEETLSEVLPTSAPDVLSTNVNDGSYSDDEGDDYAQEGTYGDFVASRAAGEGEGEQEEGQGQELSKEEEEERLRELESVPEEVRKVSERASVNCFVYPFFLLFAFRFRFRSSFSRLRFRFFAFPRSFVSISFSCFASTVALEKGYEVL